VRRPEKSLKLCTLIINYKSKFNGNNKKIEVGIYKLWTLFIIKIASEKILDEKELFPDYEPKRTPDTVHDYLRNPKSIVYDVLNEIGQPGLKKLKTIIELFEKYQKLAVENPGSTIKGKVYLGADPDQYYPSDEEILASELGKMIRNIIRENTKEEIEKYIKEENIKVSTLEFNEITFRHVDVMGSGRFFYAEKKELKEKIQIL